MISQMIADSATLRVCRAVGREYRESRFYNGLLRFFDALGRAFDGSLFLSFCRRESAFARAWDSSLTCRLVCFLLSLPGLLLHRLYLAFKKPCDESVLLRLFFEAGDGAALLESWVILGLWVIPFRYWDNAYHMLGYLAVLGLLWMRMMKDGRAFPLKRMGAYLAVFALAIILSVPLSHIPAFSRRYLRYHLICMLCVISTLTAPRGVEELKRMAAAAGAVVLISSVWAVVQRVQGVEVVAAYVDRDLNAGMPGRVQSYFDNPNTFAQVLVMLLPLPGALILVSKKPLGKAAALIVLLLGILALGMTYSRASWLGLALAALVFLALWKPKLIPALVLVGLLCTPLLPESIINRILTIGKAGSDSTFTSRIPLYEAGFKLLKRFPIRGAGLGGDTVRECIRFYHIYWQIIYYAHLHNLFLEVWVEGGLLGFLSFIGGTLWGLKGMSRSCRRGTDRTARIFCAASCSALAGSLLTGMVDYIWAYPRVMCIYWFVFAFGLAAMRFAGERPAAEKGAAHV